jgi:hypothetical protein
MAINPRPAQVFVRGQGAWLWDAAGTRYLDWLQGWAVNSLGHCPPELTQALHAQAGQLITPSPALHNAPAIELATRSRVESDEEGARYGFSQSPWERALLMTRSEGAPDVATPAMERQLADLLKRKGRRLAVDDDLAKFANLGASHLLAWRSNADFQSAVEGTLEDDRSVVMLRVRSSTDPASQKLYSQAEAAYQVRELTVLAKDDDRFAGLAMDAGLEDGAVMAMPWDPLSFTLLKAADANAFLDVDPSRLGTQVVVELDVSGLPSGVYYGILENSGRKISRKLVISR